MFDHFVPDISPQPFFKQLVHLVEPPLKKLLDRTGLSTPQEQRQIHVARRVGCFLITIHSPKD
jgi:hypothetical protein